MNLLRLDENTVIVPALIAGARVGFRGTCSTVEVLMPMGSEWVTVWRARPDSIGAYEGNARHLDEANRVLGVVLSAMGDA